MKKLNMNKIEHRIVRSIDMQTALDGVSSMEWPDEVISGEKKVYIENAETEETCVRLETSFL